MSASCFPPTNLLLLHGGKHGYWGLQIPFQSTVTDLLLVQNQNFLGQSSGWLAWVTCSEPYDQQPHWQLLPEWEGEAVPRRNRGEVWANTSGCLLQTRGWTLRSDSSVLIPDLVRFPTFILSSVICLSPFLFPRQWCLM